MTPAALTLPFASYHFGTDYHTVLYKPGGPGSHYETVKREDIEYNEFNTGIGLDWQVHEQWRIEAGVYNNSYEDWSPYIGANWLPVQGDRFELGIAGAMAYYPEIPSGEELVPLIGPIGAVRIGPTWLRATIGPRGDGNYLATFSLRIPFGRKD